MTGIKIKQRKTGATAVLGRSGLPVLTTETGAVLEVAGPGDLPGFSPLDLLYASLAACIVLSVRIAASEAGILSSIERIEACVTGEKAEEPPSRVARTTVALQLDGDLSEEQRAFLAARAEEICTISNTLHNGVDVSLTRAA